ncbi:bifunctional 3,4-dihydroxy-2-butanone-4-phosphate synthase/GTP cyclohydrolase II [Ileibacterium valens]|uniref:bifunctional 3,4-dihydroxy-2-butanone-4-phosphate synthase/GTP cyclohydrolase II n=1 Tax=Ileibacterium valens TaxID=1862668 RepID=UPI00272A30E5|nr:bifunctional 3,4-dihydroxy-2-butanone-4-phosphate synthase/GTP cyclohydrolase II [Ileibacterium valens]
MTQLNTIDEALEDLKSGKVILVIDDPDRENEGDLICAAEFANQENINFMATFAKGLICMPLSEEIAQRLNLKAMCEKNTDNHETAFTVSIDHISTTTGISAKERAITAAACANPESRPEDFRRPGHLFPLISKPKGVLERNGHTEATVDLCKLAGLEACGICCEIMSEDGSMMRTEELMDFAKKHDLKMISIADLQKYRKMKDCLVEQKAKVSLPTKYGNFTAYGFASLDQTEPIVLIKGEVSNRKNVLCWMHSECLTGDVFGSKRCDCGEQLERSLRAIEERGEGILIYLRQEARGIGLLNKLLAYELQEQGYDTLDANLHLGFGADERDYFIAAQILNFLNVKSIELMTNNPDKVTQLEQYGIQISSRIPVEIEACEHDHFYLQTKQDRMGHLLHINQNDQ